MKPLELKNERLKGEVTRHSERTVLLEEELRWWKAPVFGRNAQHHSPNAGADQQMLFNEAEVLSAIEAADTAHANRTTKIAAHERVHTGGRKAIPKEFPRKDIPHDIDEQEKRCPHDGCVLERFGEEVSERYGYRRPLIWVERHIRHRYGRPTAAAARRSRSRPSQHSCCRRRTPAPRSSRIWWPTNSSMGFRSTALAGSWSDWAWI